MTVYEWQPGTQYDAGSIVVYQASSVPAFLQSGWEPTLTPALWGRLPEEYHEPHHEQHHEQHHEHKPPPQQPAQQPHGSGPGGCNDDKRWDQHSQQTVPIHEEERKHGWDSLSDERKKQIEIGGGLVAGLALLGGGLFAFKEHEKNEEEKKALLWSLQNWVHDAEVRRRDFYEGRRRGPVSWILVEGKNIPKDIAIPGGEEHGITHYICRGFHNGSIQVGKACDIFKEGGVIGYGHDEVHLSKFEVLVGERNAVKWVDWHGRVDLNALGARPVEGGHESDNTPLYIAQAHHHNAIVPGKCSTKLKAAFIPYGNSEKEKDDYRILCYN